MIQGVGMVNDKRILRVFPRRTSMMPKDELVFVGDPQLFRPNADCIDEVHVSVTFTWDVEEGKRLEAAWSDYYPIVKLGGPAFGSKQNGFVPGKYIRNGVTFTTRGCNRKCPWCLVPEREGRLREIKSFVSGHIVQDNNLLQSSKKHMERVFDMLRSNRRFARFSGGLDSRLITDWVADQLRNVNIIQLFLAADNVGMLKSLEKAIKKLSFLERRKLRVYVMIGYDGETREEAEDRLEKVWKIGGLPYAQLYQPKDKFIKYSLKWKKLAYEWSRPAVMRSMHGGSYE